MKSPYAVAVEQLIANHHDEFRRLLRQAEANGGQPPLFDVLSDPDADTEGQSHADGPDTERLAALKVMPRTGTQRRRVLEAIAAVGLYGHTDHEISEITGIYLYSAAPRRNELLNGGWLEDSGKRRPTPMGGDAIVWRLTAAGHQALSLQQNVA